MSDVAMGRTRADGPLPRLQRPAWADELPVQLPPKVLAQRRARAEAAEREYRRRRTETLMTLADWEMHPAAAAEARRLR